MADIDSPRVTIGIATYNRDAYLAEAIESCLSQDYESFEVLVVADGSTNAEIDDVLASFADAPALRVVRHERNLGIAAAYNTFVSSGRGELIAMLGDDDLALPSRIRRQVEIFDRHPDTGVVHGDGAIIDASGRQVGLWNSRDFSPTELIRAFFFSHNHLVDPTRMVHRRVYERVGGYDARYPVANDMDFWLRAAPLFRFRHCPGGPLCAIRRHGANASDELAGREAETADVEAILRAALERLPLRQLVPELDWATLDPHAAERTALMRIADGLERRALALPHLAAELRARADTLPAPTRPVSRQARGRRPAKLMITAFGWNDPGGGTTVPRLTAKELARRGWEVTVFHAAVKPSASRVPYEQVEWEEDGVRLIGIHNRPHALFDLGNPWRELSDPPITAAFAQALDRLKPDVVHFHNLHNLGAELIATAAVRGIPAFFTTHNYWLICPRAYLMNGTGEICPGPGDGSRCATCVQSSDVSGHQHRLAALRSRAQSGLTRVLAVSDAVRATLIGAGYPPSLIDTVRQAMPHELEIWDAVGRDRRPGRPAGALTVAFLGSAYPHKGPQLLVQAAQLMRARARVRIIGEIQPAFAERLRALDTHGIVELSGSFAPSELGGLLSAVDVAVLPSAWWDCAPLAAAECSAARVPLVVPRLGGLPESIRDEHTGLTFAALDATDLARQLDRLADEPGLLERLQANIGAPRRFSDYVDQLEAYYDGSGREAEPATAERATEPSVRWKGDHGLPTSLSIINDEVTACLTAAVQRVDRDGHAVDPPLLHAADVEVRHQWPPDFSVPPSGRLATIVPWEFGAVPDRWVEAIEANVDELWVPSAYVRNMYVECGVDPGRVHVIPNGVDLRCFHPADSVPPSVDADDPLRFLFVGGITPRKGIDLLLEAWDAALAGRSDVTLVVKAAMAAGAYGGPSTELRERASSGRLPRVELIEDDLDSQTLADLYRSCDVFVLPYRGEGFAMPVLEAMACGLPVIVTAGGPTDEFCPAGAGWRISSTRKAMPRAALGELTPSRGAWMLEPDHRELVQVLIEVAGTGREQLAVRGHLARAAAESYPWTAVARRYDERIAALAHNPIRRTARAAAPFPLDQEVRLRVLATPAWRGSDRIGELLDAWAHCTHSETSARLYLLADPDTAGAAEDTEAHILDAARRSGVDLDACADIEILFEPFRPDRDARLHAATDVFVPLHPGCAGQTRQATAAGSRVVEPLRDQLASVLADSGLA